MKHATKQFLSVTAVGLILVSGCAAGPQRLPGAGAQAPGQKIASTTGDMDACAMALGNLEWNATGPTTGALGWDRVGPAGAATPGDTDRMPPLLRGNTAPQGERAAIPWTTGNRGNALTGGLRGGNNLTGAAIDGTPDPATVPIMANGVLIGNIALVALPDDETTKPGSAGAPAGGVPAGGATLPGDRPLAPGEVGTGRLILPPGVAGNPVGMDDSVENGRVTGGMAGRTVTGAGAAGFTGSPGAVGTAPGATGPAGPTGLQAGAAGTGVGAAQVGPEQSAGSPKVALDRIVTSCGRLSQIRTVAEGNDEVRMAEITSAIRRGTPITDFMQELTEMNVRAAVAWTAPAGTFGMTPTPPGPIRAGAR